jgi:hypothetical protein
MRPKWELRTMVKVKTSTGFSLICTFDDASVRTFDLTPLLKKGGEVIMPLKRKAFFDKVFIEMGTPTWPNGFDLCSDYIYQNSIPVRTSKKAKNLFR